MKKLQKVLAIMCVLTSFGVANDIRDINKVEANEVNNSEIMPMYIAISYTYSGISLGSGWKVTCNGITEVWDGYRAAVDVELQMKIGSVWTTIKTWSASDWDYASVERDWYVESGYEYRVKTTHYSYDSNWNQLEKVTKYSNTVR